MQLPAGDGVALLEWAFNDEWEHNVFLRWIAGHEFGMSFNDFMEQVRPRPMKTTADVLKDVQDILDSNVWQKSS